MADRSQFTSAGVEYSALYYKWSQYPRQTLGKQMKNWSFMGQGPMAACSLSDFRVLCWIVSERQALYKRKSEGWTNSGFILNFESGSTIKKNSGLLKVLFDLRNRIRRQLLLIIIYIIVQNSWSVLDCVILYKLLGVSETAALCHSHWTL